MWVNSADISHSFEKRLPEKFHSLPENVLNAARASLASKAGKAGKGKSKGVFGKGLKK